MIKDNFGHVKIITNYADLLAYKQTASDIETFGITGYNHVGLTRQNGKGGDVSLFISDDIVFSELQELSMVQDHIECIFIKIIFRDIHIS